MKALLDASDRVQLGALLKILFHSKPPIPSSSSVYCPACFQKSTRTGKVSRAWCNWFVFQVDTDGGMDGAGSPRVARFWQQTNGSWASF